VLATGGVEESAMSRVSTVAIAALVAVGAAWLWMAVLAGQVAGETVTSYAVESEAARWVDLAAGLSLLAVGVVGVVRRRSRTIGLIAFAAGIAWFAFDLDGWDGGSSIARALGALIAPLLPALLLHVALALPGGRLRSRPARVIVGAAYLVALVVAVGRAAVRDPFLDAYCWRNCSDNVFLLHADAGVGRALDLVWLWSSVALGIAVVGVAVGRVVAATAPGRRMLAPALVPAALAGAAEAGHAALVLFRGLEDPELTSFSVAFFARAVTLCGLAAGIAWVVAGERRRRARVARLASELGEAPRPGQLRDALATALRDPDVDVLYWVADPGRFVDAAGVARSVDPADSGRGRAVTRITRAGRLVAVVVHDPALVSGNELEREIGSAARLAVENEALRAEVLAQVNELRASRARIVETGDAARRRLERNLHDGAQQRLLAVLFELRLARTRAQAGDDAATERLVDDATEEVELAFADLRTLARGIYPAALTEAGLEAALETFAETAPIAVELDEVVEARYPAAVESGAYVTVAEAIRDAEGRGASFVSVRATQSDGVLVITAHDDGTARTDGLRHVADRVGALGGSLVLAGTQLRAEIPCA
jgi:signal transduction histidine kinase